MFNNETKIMLLKQRKNLLTARNAAVNTNLIRKIDRQLRKLGA